MHAEISPVGVYPGTATRLYVRNGPLGPPPGFYYELQSVTTTPGTPASGTPGAPDYVPAVPPMETAVALKNGNVAMTDAQWNAWTDDEPDDLYILQCTAANLGLTLAP